jgi:DNA modification methylase
MSAPWMPLYVADYLADTRRLSTLEHGAYMLLIMDYWRNGNLPEDDVTLARIAGLNERDWLLIRGNIEKLFLPGWNARQARDEKDDRHLCPLQIDVIERCLDLYSNPGDRVYSPFMGIGSEGFASLRHGRKFIGTELKPAYFAQAVKFLREAETQGVDRSLFGNAA